MEDMPVWKQWWLHINWKWDIPAVINRRSCKMLNCSDLLEMNRRIVSAQKMTSFWFFFLVVAFFFSWSSLRSNCKIILCKLTYVYLDKSVLNFLINLWRLFSTCQHLGCLRHFFFILSSPPSARKVCSCRLASLCAKLARKTHNGLEVTAELLQEEAVFTQRYGRSVESTNCTECFSQFS